MVNKLNFNEVEYREGCYYLLKHYGKKDSITLPVCEISIPLLYNITSGSISMILFSRYISLGKNKFTSVRRQRHWVTKALPEFLYEMSSFLTFLWYGRFLWIPFQFFNWLAKNRTSLWLGTGAPRNKHISEVKEVIQGMRYVSWRIR